MAQMGILDLFEEPSRRQNRAGCKPRLPPDQHTKNHQMIRRKVVRYTFVNERVLHRYEAGSDFGIKQAILAGLEAWDKVNRHRFLFARKSGRAPLRIRFIRLDDHTVHTTQGTFPRGTISIDLSKHEMADDLRDTVAHDFGHIIGYGHTGEPGNLMFSLDAYHDNHHSPMRDRRGFHMPKLRNLDWLWPPVLEVAEPVYGRRRL